MRIKRKYILLFPLLVIIIYATIGPKIIVTAPKLDVAPKRVAAPVIPPMAGGSR